MVQNFVVFADSSAAMKIRTTKNVLVCISYSTESSAGTKFRTTKFSSEVLDGKSVKFCTRENFLLYSIYAPNKEYALMESNLAQKYLGTWSLASVCAYALASHWRLDGSVHVGDLSSVEDSTFFHDWSSSIQCQLNTCSHCRYFFTLYTLPTSIFQLIDIKVRVHRKLHPLSACA